MQILVAYDVNTLTPEGRKRLRLVAKACKAFGQRVQFSVFECSLTDMQLERLRTRLLKIVVEAEDRLRIYTLRGKREEVVESYGRDTYVDPMDPMIV
jgi:CRISPR-associated protein Cas2